MKRAATWLAHELAGPLFSGVSLALVVVTLTLMQVGELDAELVLSTLVLSFAAGITLIIEWAWPGTRRTPPEGHHYLGMGGSEASSVSGAPEGWKVGRMLARADGSELCFQPTAHPGRIRAEADAECALGCPEPASPGCSCGFHAYRDEKLARGHDQGGSETTLLRVALSGRFVEYSGGWRYSHQRIKEARVRLRCGSRWCRKPAAALVITDVAVRDEVVEEEPWFVVGGTCAECAVRGRLTGRALSFEEASAVLTSQLSHPQQRSVAVVSDKDVVPLSRSELEQP